MNRPTRGARHDTDWADGAQWLRQFDQARIALRQRFEAMHVVLAPEQPTNRRGPTPRVV